MPPLPPRAKPTIAAPTASTWNWGAWATFSLLTVNSGASRAGFLFPWVHLTLAHTQRPWRRRRRALTTALIAAVNGERSVVSAVIAHTHTHPRSRPISFFFLINFSHPIFEDPAGIAHRANNKSTRPVSEVPALDHTAIKKSRLCNVSYFSVNQPYCGYCSRGYFLGHYAPLVATSKKT